MKKLVLTALNDLINPIYKADSPLKLQTKILGGCAVFVLSAAVWQEHVVCFKYMVRGGF